MSLCQNNKCRYPEITRLFSRDHGINMRFPSHLTSCCADLIAGAVCEVMCEWSSVSGQVRVNERQGRAG